MLHFFSQYSRILANVSLVLVQKMITSFVKLSVREHLRGHPALLRAAVCDLVDLLLPDVEKNCVFKSLT